MAAPNVRMQISAGVGSGENKKLKIKSIFMNSSGKFRPVKKKERGKKKRKLPFFSFFFAPTALYAYRSYTHTQLLTLQTAMVNHSSS